MISKFFQGIVVGAGLAVGFLVVLVTGLLVVPVKFSSAPIPVTTDATAIGEAESAPATQEEFIAPAGREFHELPLEGQIQAATVIALARYEEGPDGRMKAVVSEFLKKRPGIKINYNIGDEYPSGSYYPNEMRSKSDGMVLFFTGSPAFVSVAIPYSGERIKGLNDIPMKLFKEKCQANAQLRVPADALALCARVPSFAALTRRS